jgi:hypothetical protein
MISDNVEFLPPICFAVFWQPYDSIVTPTPFEPLKISLWPHWPQSWKLKDQLETYIYNSTKFHEILSSSSWDLRGQVYVPQKETKENNNNNNN